MILAGAYALKNKKEASNRIRSATPTPPQTLPFKGLLEEKPVCKTGTAMPMTITHYLSDYRRIRTAGSPTPTPFFVNFTFLRRLSRQRTRTRSLTAQKESHLSVLKALGAKRAKCCRVIVPHLKIKGDFKYTDVTYKHRTSSEASILWTCCFNLVCVCIDNLWVLSKAKRLFP